MSNKETFNIVKNRFGYFVFETASKYASQSRKRLEMMYCQDWKDLYKEGYRVKKVFIVESQKV